MVGWATLNPIPWGEFFAPGFLTHGSPRRAILRRKIGVKLAYFLTIEGKRGINYLYR
jgi:hypothetical protein